MIGYTDNSGLYLNQVPAPAPAPAPFAWQI